MSSLNFPDPHDFSHAKRTNDNSPDPSKLDADVDSIARKKLEKTALSDARFLSLKKTRLSKQSLLPPLMKETRLHHALKVYDNVPIPPGAAILLTTLVFDGVGDLEHMMRAVSGIQALHPEINLTVVLGRQDGVPEDAWQEKLSSLSKQAKVYTLKTVTADEEEIMFDPATFMRGSEMAFWEKHGPCIIGISNGYVSVKGFETVGSIHEYGFNEPFLPDLEILPTGFLSETIGLWMLDDPAFREHPVKLRVEIQKLLFGLELTDEEQDKWTIGIASLRSDRARLRGSPKHVMLRV